MYSGRVLRFFVFRGRGHLGRVRGGIVCAMTTPTFADVDAVLAKRDYKAALAMLESMEVVGEDACYRRDIQAAACADRLGRYPLCEEYATRAHSYGDDMAEPFALLARAQRRQGLVAEAQAVSMAGMRLHPQSAEIARELTLCLVDLGRYDEALPVSQVAMNGFPDDVELLMAYGHLWEPFDPDIAQRAFFRAMRNDPDREEAKFAFDSLAHPLKGAGRSSYAIEMQPAVAEAYNTMVASVCKAAPKLMKLPFISGLGCLLLYHLCLAQLMPYGARPLVLLLYIAPIADIYLHMGRQVATFNRTLPRGVRLTFMRLCTRFTELGGRIFLFMRVSLISGFFLIAFMNGIG